MEKEMLEIANFFLENDKSNRLDYVEKYEKLLERIEKSKEEKVVELEGVVERNRSKEELVAKLRAFRMEQSKKEKIKPYFIFNDVQMQNLIDRYPKNTEELCQVSGFGKVKVEKYGERILEILNE